VAKPCGPRRAEAGNGYLRGRAARADQDSAAEIWRQRLADVRELRAVLGAWREALDLVARTSGREEARRVLAATYGISDRGAEQFLELRFGTLVDEELRRLAHEEHDLGDALAD
jgi:DNA gyrase/topoisomerase IV subunit A